MIKEAVNILISGMDLSEQEMALCMTEIMEGNATDAQIGAFLTALRLKGETVQEITGAAKIMRQKAATIECPEGTLDTCGTGGDMAGTINVSTTTAFVVAASGVPIAKHGNRSVSSKSGSADLLEALGAKIDLAPRKVQQCLFETGFGFLFAPLFHPAMKYAIGPRLEIGVRTIFNILGPITNPAGAKRQLLGVFANHLTGTLCRVLAALGAEDVMVVHGVDGLDEITITDGTNVTRYTGGKFEDSIIAPEDFNLPRASLSEIEGADSHTNAKITQAILSGEKGPRRDIVLMNSAAALLVAGKAGSLAEGYSRAAEAVDSGAATAKLRQVVEFTNS